MSFDLLLENLTNPALLFFFLGIIAVQLKSDLSIPANSSKFISLYLLFSIGFKGGQELAHSQFTAEIGWSMVLGIGSAVVIPYITFLLLKRKLGTFNAGAIAAAYGSVSAVTFVTSISFLEMQGVEFGGHMVAIMAMMEAPAIVVGILLIKLYNKDPESHISFKKVLMHSLTNGSVLLIVGSLVIGMLASDKQAMGIKPFTTDIFKGFLAVFLLDMGITSGKKLNQFWQNGISPMVFAVIFPLLCGVAMAFISGLFISNAGDRFLISILAASASYIAVPAAMKLAVPKANPGLYIPMALAVTFPFNITFGIPIYYLIVS